MNGERLIKRLVILVAAGLLFACSTTPKIVDKPVAPMADELPAYKIGVGDTLQINVWKNNELSISVPVRPDGKISMPLVGDVHAAGETTTGLSSNISTALSAYIRSPQVTVIVLDSGSADFQRRIRITGAVRSPLSVPFRRGMTVLDLVLQAGGATEFASLNKAKLYRKVDDQVKVYPVYLGDILNKGKLDTNYELISSDIVTVPERVF